MIIAFFKRHGFMFFSLVGAVLLIACSLAAFAVQVKSDVEKDMRSRTEAILDTGVKLLQTEVVGLKRLTETAADLMEQTRPQTDAEIVGALQHYAENGDIMRALFVTTDRHVYTSYTGYLGQWDIGDFSYVMPIEEASKTAFLKPVYSKELGKAIFGVVTPLTLGEKAGFLVSSYDVDDFFKLFENKFLGGHAYLGILNSAGKVIVGKTTLDQPTGFGEDIFEAFQNGPTEFSYGTMEGMRDDLACQRPGFVIYSYRGTDRYCAYGHSGIEDWSVAVAAPESVLRAQAISIERRGLWLSANLVAVLVLLFLVITFVRRKEHEHTNRLLQNAAMLDGLTGIYNRGAVESAITSFLEGAGKQGKHALFIMDIDSFKSINDNYGHISGDIVLKRFSQQLQSVLGEKDIIGRMGGDEFIALLSNTEDIELVRAKAEEITRAFRHCFAMPRAGNSVNIAEISISLGIALFDSDGNSFLELYQHADDALYQTKQHGKDGFTFFRDMNV